MQRLVAQLPTVKHRHTMMHIVYTYYYADVLLAMYKIGAQNAHERNMQRNDDQDLSLFLFDGDSDMNKRGDELLQERLYESFFIEQEKNAQIQQCAADTNIRTSLMPVDAVKVARIHHLIETHFSNMRTDPEDGSSSQGLENAAMDDASDSFVTVQFDQRIGRILLQCNSQEVLLLEELMKSRTIQSN